MAVSRKKGPIVQNPNNASMMCRSAAAAAAAAAAAEGVNPILSKSRSANDAAGKDTKSEPDIDATGVTAMRGLRTLSSHVDAMPIAAAMMRAMGPADQIETGVGDRESMNQHCLMLSSFVQLLRW